VITTYNVTVFTAEFWSK